MKILLSSVSTIPGQTEINLEDSNSIRDLFSSLRVELEKLSLMDYANFDSVYVSLLETERELKRRIEVLPPPFIKAS